MFLVLQCVFGATECEQANVLHSHDCKFLQVCRSNVSCSSSAFDCGAPELTRPVVAVGGPHDGSVCLASLHRPRNVISFLIGSRIRP
jgi:hypothetical protein